MLWNFDMKEKEREIKKFIECHTETEENFDKPDFINELCRSCERLSYCIPSNCAECEFKTKCTYVYESF